MRIAFMGTPPFAVPTLAALHAAGHDVAAVYTQPPRPAQRGKKVQQSAVHDWAEAHGLTVRTPGNLKSTDEQAEFAALDLDVAVVAAYGLILPQAVLDTPRAGCLNVHGSILPRWRGAAPVQRAILAGDAETGVTIMQMDAGLDTGAMRLIGRTPVARKTAGELTDELAAMGAVLMVRVLSDLHAFAPEPQPDDGVTYAAKIDKSEARLNLANDAFEIERQIRAFNPAPGAWIDFRGKRLKILKANAVSSQIMRIDGVRQAGSDWWPGTVLDRHLSLACLGNALTLEKVQLEGRPAMEIAKFVNGQDIRPGEVLA